ncbi:type IV secretion system protein [Bartonella rattaustraliani]|uniref:type IV secretion system protein n=1 Tax=Bartonella rattaustraliani TaxID=481139 RepID=UPI00031FC57E|nr:type IV secretion system protein [Bartonella rattaustraliani]
MKKHGLITLLSLSFISHAMAQEMPSAEEYYQKIIEDAQKLDAQKAETIDSIRKNIEETETKIKEIESKLKTAKPEDMQSLQIKLSIFLANLQMDALKLQSLAMMKEKETKTKDEVREEEIQQSHKKLEEKLKEKLEKSNVRL